MKPTGRESTRRPATSMRSNVAAELLGSAKCTANEPSRDGLGHAPSRTIPPTDETSGASTELFETSTETSSMAQDSSSPPCQFSAPGPDTASRVHVTTSELEVCGMF